MSAAEDNGASFPVSFPVAAGCGPWPNRSHRPLIERLRLSVASVLVVSAAIAGGCTDPPPPEPTTGLAGERLIATVRALSDDGLEGRAVGTEGNARARVLIEEALVEAGVEAVAESYRAPFTVASGVEGVNLVGAIPGRSIDRYLLIGAHYDHLGIRNGEIYNGADDNASGVAAVLEIARNVAREPLEHSLLVVLFDGEEKGLSGSRAFVAEPPVDIEAIELVINLDMVARGEDGGLFASGTHHYPAIRPVLEQSADGGPIGLRFGHDRPEDRQDDWTLLSDHAPFHLAGIPFVYFGVEDHPDYHRPTDDWHRIDPDLLSGATIAVERALRALDTALAEGLDPRAEGEQNRQATTARPLR